jgi:DNA-binding NarL/FixJ family response regulator
MNGATRILIVHENPLVRDCLTSVLTAADSQEAVALDPAQTDWAAEIDRSAADVVVVDLALPKKRASALISHVRRVHPSISVVALISEFVERDVVDAVVAGATVCIPERATLDELRVAIHYARRRESYCSPLIANCVLSQLGKLARSADWAERAEAAVLSGREFEVLRLIAEDNLSNKEIARELSLSLYTVKNHVHNILDKLSVHDRYAAAEYARERAWL